MGENPNMFTPCALQSNLTLAAAALACPAAIHGQGFT
jgi:hypothetical protein